MSSSCLPLSALMSRSMLSPRSYPKRQAGSRCGLSSMTGPSCFTLTAEEAGWLSEQIARQLTEGADPTGGA